MEDVGAADLGANHVVGRNQAQVLCFFSDQSVLDERFQGRPVDAQREGAIMVDLGAQNLAQALVFAREGRAHGFVRNIGVADPGHTRTRDAAGDHVADAPDGEAEDQDDEQPLDDPRGGVFSNGVEHGLGAAFGRGDRSHGFRARIIEAGRGTCNRDPVINTRKQAELQGFGPRRLLDRDFARRVKCCRRMASKSAMNADGRTR